MRKRAYKKWAAHIAENNFAHAIPSIPMVRKLILLHVKKIKTVQSAPLSMKQILIGMGVLMLLMVSCYVVFKQDAKDYDLRR